MTKPPQEIVTAGTLADRAGQEPTRAQADQLLLSELPPLLADPVPEEPSANDWTDVQRAVSWAFGYQVEHSSVDGRKRVLLGPYFASSLDEQVPPPAESISGQVADVWESLAGVVTSPYAVSRLEHVLFAVKRGNGFRRATAAAEAYLRCADGWSREQDSIADIQTALALCRAVGNHQLRQLIIGLILDRAHAALTPVDGAAGSILGYLELLDGERDVPGRFDDLLTQAVTQVDYPWLADRLHLLRRRRAADAEAIAAVDADRVHLWMDAGAAAAGLIRSAHLKQALAIAETSGQPGLIDAAAAALQAVPKEDLGLVAMSAKTSIAREHIEDLIAPVTQAPTWREALSVFAVFGPPAGDVSSNRASAAEQARQFVFRSLMPREIIGGDGLPRFRADSDESKAEMALSEQEVFWLQSLAPIVAHALTEIKNKHGIPPAEDLTAYFAEMPGIDSGIAATMARVLQRYWTDDMEGAAFTAAPRVEAIARRLAVALQAGVCRLQRQERPGQYPGLGALLEVLWKRGMDESWYRSIYTATCNPAGWNLRNELSHGFVDNCGAPHAAVLIQAMLYLSELGRGVSSAASSPGESAARPADPPSAQAQTMTPERP